MEKSFDSIGFPLCSGIWVMDEGKTTSLTNSHGERQRASYGREKEIQKTEGKRREKRTTRRGWDLGRVLERCFILFHLVGGAEWKDGARDEDGERVFEYVFLCVINKNPLLAFVNDCPKDFNYFLMTSGR